MLWGFFNSEETTNGVTPTHAHSHTHSVFPVQHLAVHAFGHVKEGLTCTHTQTCMWAFICAYSSACTWSGSGLPAGLKQTFSAAPSECESLQRKEKKKRNTCTVVSFYKTSELRGWRLFWFKATKKEVKRQKPVLTSEPKYSSAPGNRPACRRGGGG